MAHIVKCFYCGQRFDTEKVEFIKPNKNRYAHKECPIQQETDSSLPPVFQAAAPTKVTGIEEAELQDYRQLTDYINEVFKGKVNWAATVTKMKQLRGQQYTYSGMYKALKWWYEICKHSTAEAKTPLGIIPFIYNDAFDYYKAIYEAEQANRKIELQEKVVDFYIDPPEVKPMVKIRLFDLDKEVRPGEE